jgi:predicted nucleic acid-binding protein
VAGPRPIHTSTGWIATDSSATTRGGWQTWGSACPLCTGRPIGGFRRIYAPRLGRDAVLTALEPLVMAGQVVRAGISDLEIGFSARTLREWTRLASALVAFPLIETDASHVRRARQVQRLLAARGLRGRKVPDLLIAAAETSGLAVLHYDGDFDVSSRVTGQPGEWRVPSGTID